MRDIWNPQQYEKFKDERHQPFLDLLALVKPQADARVADLACGTGDPTQTLHQFIKAREPIAAEVAGESPFAEALSGYERDNPVLKPEEYAVLLHKLGFREQTVRLQVYCHLLESKENVIEWVKGTRLTDYQKRMPEELYPKF